MNTSHFPCTMSVHIGLVCVCTLLAVQGGILATASCSYWYFLVPSPEQTCDPLGVNTSLSCGVYVPQHPPTTVKWYKSENKKKIIAIPDNTDEYEVKTQLATTSVSNGNFSGLFFNLYFLTIINFTASDSGYYWCHIETNSTEDSLLFMPSQYGYLVPDLKKSKCTSRSEYFESLNPKVCAIHMSAPSLSPTISHIVTLHSSISALFPHTSASMDIESTGDTLSSTVTPSTTIHSASLKKSPPSPILTSSAKAQSPNLYGSMPGNTVLPPSPMSSRHYSLPSKVPSVFYSTHFQNFKVGSVTPSVTPSLRSTTTKKTVNMFAVFGATGGAILLLVCVAAVIVPCTVICQYMKRRRQLWKERGRPFNISVYRPTPAEDHMYSMVCHSKPTDGPIYAKPIVEKTSNMLGGHVNGAQSPAYSLGGASDDEYAMPQDAVLPDVVSGTTRRNVTPYDSPLQKGRTASKTPRKCDPVYSVPVVDQSRKHATFDQNNKKTVHAIKWHNSPALNEASPGSSVHEYAVLEPNSKQATPLHCHVDATQELYSHPAAQEVMFDDPIYSAGRVN